jgi:hypothetical protein
MKVRSASGITDAAKAVSTPDPSGNGIAGSPWLKVQVAGAGAIQMVNGHIPAISEPIMHGEPSTPRGHHLLTCIRLQVQPHMHVVIWNISPLVPTPFPEAPIGLGTTKRRLRERIAPCSVVVSETEDAVSQPRPNENQVTLRIGIAETPKGRGR